jgi:superkiller protein 3
VYYSEYADPPDPVRASKCFQKAVELDSREGDAARRLAEGFADEREWDLVEVVARRTIEGEGGAEGDVTSNAAAAARYKPVNAWAWKSMGVVELVCIHISCRKHTLDETIFFRLKNRGNFQPAIISLQIALRADEKDYRVWIRLGEAYSRSGRPAAALKALNRAHELAPDEWTCLLFTADVYRQMGLYETAIAILEQVLQSRPAEVGILVTLAESHLALGRSELAAGFQSRAEISWSSAVIVACSTLSSATGYKRIAWKTVADALFELSRISSFTAIEEVSLAIQRLSNNFDNDALTGDTKIASAAPLNQIIMNASKALCGKSVTWLAAAAYHTRIQLCEDDDDLEAAAFYDYAVACHSLASVCPAEEASLVLAEAITSAKSALRYDPGNEACWNALGVMSFASDPKIAQHAFIRAIELDQKVHSFLPSDDMRFVTPMGAESCVLDKPGVAISPSWRPGACKSSFVQGPSFEPRVFSRLGRSGVRRDRQRTPAGG